MGRETIAGYAEQQFSSTIFAQKHSIIHQLSLNLDKQYRSGSPETILIWS